MSLLDLGVGSKVILQRLCLSASVQEQAEVGHLDVQLAESPGSLLEQHVPGLPGGSGSSGIVLWGSDSVVLHPAWHPHSLPYDIM